MESALRSAGEDYSFEYRFGRFWVDFWLPHRRLVIECDEPYWHNAEKDAVKDEYIRSRFGVRIARLTTAQILNPNLTENLHAVLERQSV